MPLFKCEKCGCIENTACCNYWVDHSLNKKKALCSECDHQINKWHGIFDKKPATGMLLGEDGFLYSEDPKHTKIVGKIE